MRPMSHAVLLCWMEQGEVKDFLEVFAIERIWRANAQKHVQTPSNISGMSNDNKIFFQNYKINALHIL